MKRRWIIRSFAMALVIACSAAWVRSYYVSTQVNYAKVNSSITLESLRGKISVWKFRGESFFIGLQFIDDKAGHLDDYEIIEADDRTYVNRNHIHRFFGFVYGSYPTPSSGYFNVGFAIPYWFLDASTILIGIYVWRKTRSKPNPRAAFPVEMDKMNG